MTIYDKLRESYHAAESVNSSYWHAAEDFIHGFAAGYGAYLGAPEEFDDLASRKKIPYVQICEVSKDEDEEEYKFKPRHFRRALTRQEDGFFIFGLQVFLERAPNSYPKNGLSFVIEIFPKEGVECSVRIYERVFEVKLDDESSWKIVYDHMTCMIERWIDAKPWDVKQRQQIGFIHDKELKQTNTQ